MRLDDGALFGSRYPELLVPGWFHSHKLYEAVVDKCYHGSVFVELGSYFGESTIYMAKLLEERNIEAELYAIDLMVWCEWMDMMPYESEIKRNEHLLVRKMFGRSMERIFAHYIKKYRVANRIKLLLQDSIKAANLYDDGSVDFVYLDTEHSYERVSEEIKAWYSKVKPQGTIGGDDFNWNDRGDGGVRRAIEEQFGSNYATDGITWFHIKP